MRRLLTGLALVSVGMLVGTVVTAAASAQATSPVTLCVDAKGGVTYPGAGNECGPRKSPLAVASDTDVQALIALVNVAITPSLSASDRRIEGNDLKPGSHVYLDEVATRFLDGFDLGIVDADGNFRWDVCPNNPYAGRELMAYGTSANLGAVEGLVKSNSATLVTC